MEILTKVKEVIVKYSELGELFASPEVTSNPKKMKDVGREYNHLGKIIPTLNSYVDVTNAHREAKELLKDESDADIIALAHEEIKMAEDKIPKLEKIIKHLLVPRDPIDSKNAMIEIRAGSGGVEAGIFAANLYRMYCAYIENKGWKIEILSSSIGELNAIKEIVFMVNAENAYGTLKYESGVHRVQRVPQTESQGRVHTSAASVAVLPEADDIEINIEPDDLRIDVFRASGAGGQHVNKTESAVRIVHLETGITVSCQDEKSQLKNKSKAMKVLKSRLFDNQQLKRRSKESATRKSLVGTGDRSAKIRTYNYPQSRVTDHRINLTLYRLDEILNGDIQELIDSLAIADLNARVEQG